MTMLLPAADPAGARAQYRDGLAVPSSGWAPGYTQANLVVVPQDWAYDVLLFGLRNPKPVPLLDVTDAGSYRTALAPDADLRTDLPRYRVWRDGELVGEPTDVVDLWRDDLVAFLIGCSFSFETALLDAGVPVHVGAPDTLGVADLGAPDFGDPVEFADGDVPVFWACGVTPQAALMASRPPFAITHAPGHMFVTDVPDAVYRQS